jgi:hypothetical protein
MLEQQIKQELRAWSKHALESPSPFFNNLPACPYAKKAWEEDKVGFVFKTEDDNLCLYQTIAGFDDRFEVIMVVDLSYKKDPEDFEDFIHALNEAISEGIVGQRDVWVMGFHPDDDADDLLGDGTFSPLVDEKYAIIFVQRLKSLHEKSKTLKAMGYYDRSFEVFENTDLYAHREELYRRLTNGDETP